MLTRDRSFPTAASSKMPKKKSVTLPATPGTAAKKPSGGKKSGGKKTAVGAGFKSIAENRKAKFQYELIDSIECGMALMGSEVKSMREGKLSLDEAYIRVQQGELWLIGSDIGHYHNAGMWNHDPRRPRKLLLHAREFESFAGMARERGLTLIPLRVYFNERGIAKCVMGLVRGKKLHDKRETIKKREAERGLQRVMRKR